MKVIAEAGVNWKNLDEAFLMIKKSKDVDCWATKFQIYNDEVIKDSEHYDFLKSIMITEPEAILLVQYGHMLGQEVFFTPMYDCIDWLNTIGVSMYKIRYKDQNNLELVNKIFNDMELLFDTEKIFISTDYPNLYHRLGFIPFSCVPKYPAKFEDYYMIRRHFEETHYRGISDHTSDFQLLKYALKWEHLIEGDYYFEKHVCLDDDCLETDWSVTFEQLAEVLKS